MGKTIVVIENRHNHHRPIIQHNRALENLNIQHNRAPLIEFSNSETNFFLGRPVLLHYLCTTSALLLNYFCTTSALLGIHQSFAQFTMSSSLLLSSSRSWCSSEVCLNKPRKFLVRKKIFPAGQQMQSEVIVFVIFIVIVFV